MLLCIVCTIAVLRSGAWCAGQYINIHPEGIWIEEQYSRQKWYKKGVWRTEESVLDSWLSCNHFMVDFEIQGSGNDPHLIVIQCRVLWVIWQVMNTSSLRIMVAANEYTGYLSEELSIKVKVCICINCAVKQCIQRMSEQIGSEWDLLFACMFLIARTKMFQICCACSVEWCCNSQPYKTLENSLWSSFTSSVQDEHRSSEEGNVNFVFVPFGYEGPIFLPLKYFSCIFSFIFFLLQSWNQ